MRLPGWAGAYVGIPYVTGGRAREGCDCWGLVRLVYADVLRVALPEYDGGPDDAWSRVDATQPFDVVTFWTDYENHRTRTRAESHCGIMLSTRHLLHADPLSGSSVIVPINLPMLRGRIAGRYRYAAMNRPASPSATG